MGRRSGSPKEAGVPLGMIFRTKLQPAPEIVAAAAADGVSFRRVCGDGVYGASPAFVQGLLLPGNLFDVDSSADARVWTSSLRA